MKPTPLFIFEEEDDRAEWITGSTMSGSKDKHHWGNRQQNG